VQVSFEIAKQGMVINYVDFMSIYPYVMFKYKMPFGKPKIQDIQGITVEPGVPTGTLKWLHGIEHQVPVQIAEQNVFIPSTMYFYLAQCIFTEHNVFLPSTIYFCTGRIMLYEGLEMCGMRVLYYGSDLMFCVFDAAGENPKIGYPGLGKRAKYDVTAPSSK